jgi:hypothetical protein
MILEQSEAAYKVKITQQIHEGKSFGSSLFPVGTGGA